MYNYGYEVLCTPTCISFPCKPPLKCHISRCNILYFCRHFLLKEMHQILSNCRYHNQYKHIDNFMFQPDSCNCIQTLRVDFYIQPGLFCHNHGGRFYPYQIVILQLSLQIFRGMRIPTTIKFKGVMHEEFEYPCLSCTCKTKAPL